MSGFVKIASTQIDLAERATARTLLQFRQSQLFLDLLQTFIAEVNHLQGAISGVIDFRGPADAAGENLDAIGRIVGQGRTILNYEALAWFTPDTLGLGVDQAPAWVVGAATSGSYKADDIWYRELIEARIFRNFSYYGSIPEIQNVITQALGVNVGFYRTGPMEAQMLVPNTAPMWVINFLLSEINNAVEGVTFPPFAATLNIDSVLYIPTVYFAPDIGPAADVGAVSVSSSLHLGSTTQ